MTTTEALIGIWLAGTVWSTLWVTHVFPERMSVKISEKEGLLVTLIVIAMNFTFSILLWPLSVIASVVLWLGSNDGKN